MFLTCFKTSVKNIQYMHGYYFAIHECFVSTPFRQALCHHHRCKVSASLSPFIFIFRRPCPDYLASSLSAITLIYKLCKVSTKFESVWELSNLESIKSLILRVYQLVADSRIICNKAGPNPSLVRITELSKTNKA